MLNSTMNLEEKIVAKASERGIPIFSTFELTPLCNLACEMCFIRMSAKEIQEHNGIKPLNFWLHQAEELREMGSLLLLLTGGEPFLYPEFNQLYIELKKLGFIITINSNGTCITNEQIEILAKYRPRCINITLYGTSDVTYNKNCHNSHGYTQCIENIKKLQAHNLDIKLNYSATKQNVNEFEGIIKISEELNIPLETNSYMFPFTRSVRKKDINDARLSAECGGKINALTKIPEKKGKYKIYRSTLLNKIEKGPISMHTISLSCHAGNSSLWINWQGIMTPCVMMEEPSINLEKQSIKEGWEELKQQCKALTEFTDCIGCKLRPVCQVCYASAYLEKKYHGDLSYLCHFAQAEYETLKKIEDNSNINICD